MQTGPNKCVSVSGTSKFPSKIFRIQTEVQTMNTSLSGSLLVLALSGSCLFRNSKQKKSNLNFEFQRTAKKLKVWPLIGKRQQNAFLWVPVSSCWFCGFPSAGYPTWAEEHAFVADQNFTRKSPQSVRGLRQLGKVLEVIRTSNLEGRGEFRTRW